MPKGSSKKRKREEESQAAVRIMETIIERTEEPEEPLEITPEMRAAAAAFGRIGGKLGGPARAAQLPAAERSEIAKKAANARWNRQK